MIMGFVIWSIISAIMLGIGIWSYRSENPVGFFTGTQPPEVKDTYIGTSIWPVPPRKVL